MIEDKIKTNNEVGGEHPSTLNASVVNDKINIYGTLFNNSDTGRVAITKQLYDENFEEFQDIINKQVDDKIIQTNNTLNLLNNNITNALNNKADLDNTGKIPINQLPDSIVNESLKKVIVESLPVVGQPNTIYLILKSNDPFNNKNDNNENDIYNEYIFINNKYEYLGNTATDLSNYYTKNEVYSKNETIVEINNRAISYINNQNLSNEEKIKAIKNIGLEILFINKNITLNQEFTLTDEEINNIRIANGLYFNKINNTVANYIFREILKIENESLYYVVIPNNIAFSLSINFLNKTAIVSSHNVVDITSSVGNRDDIAISQKFATELYNKVNALNNENSIILTVGSNQNFETAYNAIVNKSNKLIYILNNNEYYLVVKIKKINNNVYILYGGVLTDLFRENIDFELYNTLFRFDYELKTLTDYSKSYEPILTVSYIKNSQVEKHAVSAKRHYEDITEVKNNISSLRTDLDKTNLNLLLLYNEVILNKINFKFESSLQYIRVDKITPFTLNWDSRFIDSDDEIKPETFKIKNITTNTFLQNVDYDAKSYVIDNIKTTNIYSAIYYIGDQFRKKDIKVKAVKPLFAYGSTSNTLLVDDIINHKEDSVLVKENFGGSEIIINITNKYLFLLVPTTYPLSLIINESNIVPIENLGTHTFADTSLGTYNVYKTINKLTGTNLNILII